MITNKFLQSETNTIPLTKRGHPTIALIYPNTYHVGMSNLGFQTLYKLFNLEGQTLCERVFMPDQHAAPRSPLRTLENNLLVGGCDLVAFSIAFENDFLNLLPLLEAAGIPLLASNRGTRHPVIMVGGAAVTINPEPIRPFVDVIFSGEAEEAITEIVAALTNGIDRHTRIQHLSQVMGCFLSTDQTSEFPAAETLEPLCPLEPYPQPLNQRVPATILKKYQRRITANLDVYSIGTVIHTPNTKFGHMALIEAQRGCPNGCRFCAEGFVFTPFRERSSESIKTQIKAALSYCKNIGLIGTNLLAYPDLAGLCAFIHEQGATFSPSSLRVDALTPEIIALLKQSGHNTITIAPEAGSEPLRFSLNKKITNTQILNAIDEMAQQGIPRVKLYFMIGLPDETDDDILALMELAKIAGKILSSQGAKTRKAGEVIVSLSPFIPKPRTPFQNKVFAGVKALTSKISLIQESLVNAGGITVSCDNPKMAYVQALLANGTSAVSQLLLSTHALKGNVRKALKGF